jgi:radical SAM superfamily enzyme YgiQ (UPF0313 family)
MSRHRRVLLAVPPTGLYLRDRCEAVALKSMMVQDIRPPMDLAYMAALLETAGHDCRIRDFAAADGDWSDVEAELDSFAPEVVVVSTTSTTIAEDMTICGMAKERRPDVLTIVKGGFLYVEDRQVLERFAELDIAIRKEAEYFIADVVDTDDLATVRGITHRRGNQIVRNPDPTTRFDLDRLPIPARHLLDHRLYSRPDTGLPLTVVLGGKGCSADCIYCSGKPFTGSMVRNRDPVAVADEMAHCVDEYDIRDFLIQTDNISHDKRWVLTLCRRLVELEVGAQWGCTSRVDTLDAEILDWMRRAGCWVISLGIESGSEEILRRAKKGVTIDQIRTGVALCRDAGVRTFLYFVIGLPWESADTVRQTIDLAKQLDGDYYEFHLAYPFPKTELHQIAFAEGLTNHELIEQGTYANPAMRSFHLSRRELARWRRRALLEVYFRPAYLRRLMTNIQSLDELVNYLRFGIRGVIAMLRG